MAEAPVVAVHGLVKHFAVRAEGVERKRQVVHAVNGVSFAVTPGETLGLVGESGCGKSTLGRMVAGILEPSSGTISYRGRPEAGLKVQMIFQDPFASLNPRMRVADIVGEAPLVHGIVTDGGLHHHLAASGNFGQVIRRNYPISVAAARDGAEAAEVAEETVQVVGCLCTPLDLLGDKVSLPRAEVGDLVVVALAGTSPGEAATTTADALGLQVTGDPAVAVVEYLTVGRWLVLLDNCEHVIASSAELADTLLRSAPGLTILATSREPFGPQREHVYSVPTLLTPPDGDMDLVKTFASAQLFVDRASQAPFAFGPSEANVVARICREVDGLPLAIEITAAFVPLLGLQQLMSEVGERLLTLTSANRYVPARHHSLLATLDDSYRLLEPDEQWLLGELAGVAEPLTLSRLTERFSGDRDSDLVFLALGGLVGKSLVEVVPGRTAKYRLLSTVRRYAAEHGLTASIDVHR